MQILVISNFVQKGPGNTMKYCSLSSNNKKIIKRIIHTISVIFFITLPIQKLLIFLLW